MRARRILILMMIVLLAAGAAYAGGNKEDNDPTNDGIFGTNLSMEDMLADDPNQINTFMGSIARIFDQTTMAFCLAATPFPNTLVQFYGMTDEYDVASDPDNIDSFGVGDSLLLSEDYYEKNAGAEDGRAKLSFNNFDFKGKSADYQRSIWNMVTILFVSFLTAEVIFTAIYHYVSDKDGSVLKEVLSKAVLSICIFLVASALPFAIEAFRIGFTTAAYTLSGVDEFMEDQAEEGSKAPTVTNAETGESATLNINSIATLNDMRNRPVFFYPGALIRLMADTLKFLDPDNIGGTGVSIKEESDAGIITGVLISIVYLIIRIVASVMILTTALHIMYNVCEVYLLLGCVMLLLPFTIFSPLKFLGEKAVMSLFSNVLELFVIVMIMFVSIMFTMTLTEALLNALLSSVREITVDVEIANVQNWVEYLKSKGEDVSDLNEDLLEDNGIFVYHDVILGYDGIELSGQYTDKYTSYLPSDSALWLNLYFQEKFEVITKAATVNQTNDQIKELKRITDIAYKTYQSKSYDDSKYPDWIAKEGFSSLPAQNKLDTANYILEEFANPQEDNFGMTLVVTSKKAGLDFEIKPWDAYFLHIICSILIVLMQTYFINQSSSITNALLSGNVSSEGFSGALTRLAGGMALKSAMGVVTAPIKMAGGLTKGAAAASILKSGGSGSPLMRLIAGEKMVDILKDRASGQGGGDNSKQSSQV